MEKLTNVNVIGLITTAAFDTIATETILNVLLLLIIKRIARSLNMVVNK